MDNINIEDLPGVTPKDVRVILDRLAVNPRTPIYIHGEWCKKCGVCIAMCPHDALIPGEDGTPEVIADKCRRCGMCELRCPDLAITLLQTRN